MPSRGEGETGENGSPKRGATTSLGCRCLARRPLPPQRNRGWETPRQRTAPPNPRLLRCRSPPPWPQPGPQPPPAPRPPPPSAGPGPKGYLPSPSAGRRTRSTGQPRRTPQRSQATTLHLWGSLEWRSRPRDAGHKQSKQSPGTSWPARPAPRRRRRRRWLRQSARAPSSSCQRSGSRVSCMKTRGRGRGGRCRALRGWLRGGERENGEEVRALVEVSRFRASTEDHANDRTH